MAGPIQTALGHLLGSLGGLAIVGKKAIDEKDERQALEAKKEKEDANQEAIAKALKQASDSKIVDPIYFWKNEEPLATSDEMAALAAKQSLFNYNRSKARTAKYIASRRELLRQKKAENETVVKE